MTFSEFAARKTAEAITASLAPLTTEVNQPTGDLEAIGNDWSRRLFDGDFYVSPPPNARHPACSLVFVQSSDGNTGARNPSALGGGETDTHLIYEGLSRVAADGVLAGAETVRHGGIMFSVWHPELVRLRESMGKSRHPSQIVATLCGVDLDRGLLFNTPDIRVFVLTVGDGADLMREGLSARPWIEPIVMQRPDDLPKAFEQLRGHGLQRVSAIGGRTIATALIDARLVQDLYLTVSPRPGGNPDTPIHPRTLQGDVVVRKHGTGSDAGVTFEHLVRLA